MAGSSKSEFCSPVAILLGWLLLFGCQLDRTVAPKTGPGLEPPDPSSAGSGSLADAGSEPNGQEGAAGASGSSGDGSGQPPSAGAAGTSAAAGTGAGTGGSSVDTPGAGQMGAAGTASPPLTADPFGRCARDADCGEGFMCIGDAPGYCGTACESDADCERGDGLGWQCDTDGACHLPCTSEGATSECPADLQCRRLSLFERECGHVLEPGARDRALLEPCDPTRGNTDCMADLICQRAQDSELSGPGYCTQRCGLLGLVTCEHATDATASYECVANACVFECSEGSCPSGMRCEPAGEQAVCHPEP